MPALDTRPPSSEQKLPAPAPSPSPSPSAPVEACSCPEERCTPAVPPPSWAHRHREQMQAVPITVTILVEPQQPKHAESVQKLLVASKPWGRFPLRLIRMRWRRVAALSQLEAEQGVLGIRPVAAVTAEACTPKDAEAVAANMKDNLSQKFESGTKSATFGRTPGCTPSAVLKSLLKIISKGCFKESVAHRSNTKEESDHDPISHGGFEAREVTETRAERHALGESQRERAAQWAIAPPPRVSTARRIGHRQRLGDLDAPPDSPTPDHHHHHRECQALVVSDTGGDATRTLTPTPTTTLTTTTNTASARRSSCRTAAIRLRRLVSDADPDSHPDPTLTTTTASARRSSCRTAATRLRRRPDSHPDPTLTTTTASARRSSCRTVATRLRRRPRLAPPPPARTTASARRSSCRAFARMRVYTQADVDHALNTPPSPSDRPGKVYGLRVKHPDGSVVLKVGRSNDTERRTEEWRCQCWKDDIVLLWEVPTNHASKLEHLCHRLFKANDAWMTPEGCESCGVFHREKFLADELGGSDEARKLVEQMAKKMRDRGE
ncbi:hypothetical protein K438DRAFT_1773738 [Mycena galopus ATCC 62051]|nr:hypothetical protein K438DRAFT_1773738 [Mycena galopus ATCC 62051]